MPLHLLNAVTSRIKVMASLDISERRLPQDGRVNVLLDGRRIDLRVSTFPTNRGEKTVIRVLDTRTVSLVLEDLGLALRRETPADHRVPLAELLVVLVHHGVGAVVLRQVGLAPVRVAARDVVDEDRVHEPRSREVLGAEAEPLLVGERRHHVAERVGEVVADRHEPHRRHRERDVALAVEPVVLALDVRHRLKQETVVSVGCLTSSLVHPREVFQVAVAARAAALILFHNHPSGVPEPSAEDVSITRRLASAGTLMGIEVLDHVILGAGRFVSLKERGIL